MSSLPNRGPRDRSVVNIHDPIELLRWAQYFGVSPGAVVGAVLKVGRNPEAVAGHLGR